VDQAPKDKQEKANWLRTKSMSEASQYQRALESWDDIKQKQNKLTDSLKQKETELTELHQTLDLSKQTLDQSHKHLRDFGWSEEASTALEILVLHQFIVIE
jgi:hypothetical protein